MSITLKSEDIQRRAAAGTARYVFTPQPRPKPVEAPALAPVPDTTLADAIAQVAAALASSQAEQRAAILQSMQVSEQLVSALRAMGKKDALLPWTAKVTKRDGLGRILEVEFSAT